jgi:Zn-dependent protease
MLNQLMRQSGSLFVLVFKLFKVFKSVKLLLAGATLATYSYLFTWEFAVAIMYAIGVHELGHVWAMRKTGMPTPGFYFVPLFGGAAIGERAKSEWQDVFITAMGPTWGLFSAIPPLALYIVTGEMFWAAIVGFIALINLFNLLPIYPLDGGRLTNSLVVSVAPGGQILYLLLAGALVITLTIYMQIYIVAILFGIGALEVYFERKRVREGQLALKPPLNRDGLIIGSVWYAGLAAIFLGIIFSLQGIEGADLPLRILQDS